MRLIGFVSPRQPTLGHVLLHVLGTAAVTAARGLHAAAALGGGLFLGFYIVLQRCKKPSDNRRPRQGKREANGP